MVHMKRQRWGDGSHGGGDLGIKGDIRRRGPCRERNCIGKSLRRKGRMEELHGKDRTDVFVK